VAKIIWAIHLTEISHSDEVWSIFEGCSLAFLAMCHPRFSSRMYLAPYSRLNASAFSFASPRGCPPQEFGPAGSSAREACSVSPTESERFGAKNDGSSHGFYDWKQEWLYAESVSKARRPAASTPPHGSNAAVSSPGG